MKKIIPIFIAGCLIFSFFIGISVGAYKLFPYSILDDVKDDLVFQEAEIENVENISIDLQNLVNIKNNSDISKKKLDLINHIWKYENLSLEKPKKINEQIIYENFLPMDNLDRIDALEITMQHGVNSIVYFFHPEKSNNELILYHQGHSGGFVNGKETIAYFVQNGYSVAAFSMPLFGMNNQPVVNSENFGQIKLISHNQFSLLENNDFSPMSYFFTPVISILNYSDEYFDFKNYSMVGISGGGWVSAIYPAIDDRISTSFSVAGSLPLTLRHDTKNIGDYEQYNKSFYEIANYFEIYLMSSFGENREFYQIFILNDPCCFSGTISNEYESEIKKILNQLGPGKFDIIIDETTSKHEISNYTKELILEKLS
jgi:hypothetical protein